MKNRSNIESRKNRRKYRYLTYTFEEQRYKIIPNILSLSVKQITREKIGNLGVKTCFA